MSTNAQYLKPLPGTDLKYYDARAACEAIAPGSYDTLPYTSRILAENLVNRADNVDQATLDSWLTQLIERKQEIDFPWFPARVVCTFSRILYDRHSHQKIRAQHHHYREWKTRD